MTINANICFDNVRPTRYAKFNNSKENTNPIDKSMDIWIYLQLTLFSVPMDIHIYTKNIKLKFVIHFIKMFKTNYFYVYPFIIVV